MSNNKYLLYSVATVLLIITCVGHVIADITIQPHRAGFAIVETGQAQCYDNTHQIPCPQIGELFYGQDASFTGNEPSYQNNGDSTITDNVTGLMWQKSADMDGDGDIDIDDKVTYDEAVAGAATFNLAGYTDWRLPTIKELYSLILFSGLDPSGWSGDPGELVPFIDTAYFDFGWGDEAAGERLIDAQYVSITLYDTTTMIDDETAFGVNFADGRIKGYGLEIFGSDKTFYVKYVRGNTAYGRNEFTDNGNGTITDNATSLMWQQGDSETGLNWEEAIAWVEQRNAENFLGYSDWRLPNIKELQSIVDYTRSPLTTGSAAIDPLFYCSQITDEAGGADYPYYWSGTTHENMVNGRAAAYVSFGRAFGWMLDPYGIYQLLDVHGAGAQRSDPKSGDPADWPYGHGPQGDVIRIYNYVRCVRDVGQIESSCGDANGDGSVNVGDAVFLINYVFKDGPAPDPVCEGNANGDSDTNVGDAVYLINYVFKSGPSPVAGCCR